MARTIIQDLEGEVYGVALNNRKFLRAQQYEDRLSGSVWRNWELRVLKYLQDHHLIIHRGILGLKRP